MPEFLIAWDAPEYEYREKSVAWYWMSIIIAAIIIAFAIWEKNFLFGLFVVLAEILLMVWGNRPPRMVHFVMDATGIMIGDERRHGFKEFEAMSVDAQGDGSAEIIFVFRERFKAPLKIIFPENRLADLRAHLKTVPVKEVPYDPSLLDSIEKLLRF